MRRALALLALGAALAVVPALAAADAVPPLLLKAALASRSANLSGTFVYQTASITESVRIARLTDASGEQERIEPLDGPRREVVRKNDEIRTFFLDSKTVRIDRRMSGRSFPALLPANPSVLLPAYAIEPGGSDRIAGHPATLFRLRPRDAERYGYLLWVSNTTGVLLKAQVTDERGQVVEQFAFTDIRFGKPDRRLLKPWVTAPYAGWTVEHATPLVPVPDLSGWTVRELPAGFIKLAEAQRVLRGKTGPVSQLHYSDGIAAVSVFIEPAAGNHQPLGLVQQGAVKIYIRQVGEYRVTVVGEAPAATVKRIGEHVGPAAGR